MGALIDLSSQRFGRLLVQGATQLKKEKRLIGSVNATAAALKVLVHQLYEEVKQKVAAATIMRIELVLAKTMQST